MFEDCETVDTIIVETNRRETINKHFFFHSQVELVLDMEKTVPAWLAKRAHLAKHVEYPNHRGSKVFITLL